MTDTASMPSSFQWGITAAGAALPLTHRFAPESCTVRRIPLKTEPNEARGALSHPIEPSVESQYVVSGTVVMVPRPEDLVRWLPLIFGGSFSGTVLTPAAIVDEFWYGKDRKAKVYNYEGMKVSKATFISRAGQQLRLQLDLEGRIRNVANAGTFPSLSLSTQVPFIHNGAVFNVASTARQFGDFNLVVDNGLILDRMFNSLTRTEIPQGDRLITLEMMTPFRTTELDILEAAVTGIAGDITWTTGGTSLLMQFPALQANIEDPEFTDRRQELMLRPVFTAKTLVGDPIADEIKITLDSTP